MRTIWIILLLSLGLASPCLARSPKAGQPAPDFTVQTLDGRSLRLAELGSQVVLVHFWATWCSSCREEMPALERFYRLHHKDGLEVIAISIEDRSDIDLVRKVAAAYSYPAALAADADLAGFGRVWVLPLSFVIDRRGLLRIAGWTGEQRIDDASLGARILPLLDER